MAQYDAYIVRVWRSAGAGATQWSGRLEYLQGGEVLRFSTPQALLAHLERLIGIYAAEPNHGSQELSPHPPCR
jgi:hypothetical protein